MLNYQTPRVTEPCAYVTKGRQRLKQYGNTVYLNNKDEFEIELFNPTTSKVLAEILIDGKPIGASYGAGLILRPGERVFLERYLNVAKKFLFETYEVDGNDPNVQRAIAENGKVEIKFYSERSRSYQINLTGGTWQWQPPTITTWPPSTGTFTYTSGVSTPTSGNSSRSFGGNSSRSKSSGDKTLYSQTFDSNISANLSEPLGFASAGAEFESVNCFNMSRDFAPMETGRVEMGSHSNQQFDVDNTEFNSWWSWKSDWKILPLSQKPLESTDIKVFCTKCGAKQKRHTHKFCPICGTKYE